MTRSSEAHPASRPLMAAARKAVHMVQAVEKPPEPHGTPACARRKCTTAT